MTDQKKKGHAVRAIDFQFQYGIIKWQWCWKCNLNRTTYVAPRKLEYPSNDEFELNWDDKKEFHYRNVETGHWQLNKIYKRNKIFFFIVLLHKQHTITLYSQ